MRIFRFILTALWWEVSGRGRRCPLETALRMGWPELWGSGGEELTGLSILVFKTSFCGLEGSVLLAMLWYRGCEYPFSFTLLEDAKLWAVGFKCGLLGTADEGDGVRVGSVSEMAMTASSWPAGAPSSQYKPNMSPQAIRPTSLLLFHRRANALVLLQNLPPFYPLQFSILLLSLCVNVLGIRLRLSKMLKGWDLDGEPVSPLTLRARSKRVVQRIFLGEVAL